MLSAGFGWKQYYDLNAIYAWIDEILEKFPFVLTNYNFGTSYENRTLRAVKVSHRNVWKYLMFIGYRAINNFKYFLSFS